METLINCVKNKLSVNLDKTTIEREIEKNQKIIESCQGRTKINERNKFINRNNELYKQLERIDKRLKLFQESTVDIQRAYDVVYNKRRLEDDNDEEKQQQQQYSKTPKRRKTQKYKQITSQAEKLFSNVTLIYNNENHIESKIKIDDSCPNCGNLMQRIPSQSILICPHLDCQFMKFYMDLSMYSSNSNNNNSSGVGHVSNHKNNNVNNNNTMNEKLEFKSKNQIIKQKSTQVSSELKAAVGETTKKFTTDQLNTVCYYAYIEGARKKEDITKEIINSAQKHIGEKQYDITLTLRYKLRGDNLKFPPEEIKRIEMVYKAIEPFFLEYKYKLSENRKNNPKKDRMMRAVLRLLGLDLYCQYFVPNDKHQPNSKQQMNEKKICSFIRFLFKKAGIEWNDCFIDFSKEEIDQFERENNITYDDVL